MATRRPTLAAAANILVEFEEDEDSIRPKRPRSAAQSSDRYDQQARANNDANHGTRNRCTSPILCPRRGASEYVANYVEDGDSIRPIRQHPPRQQPVGASSFLWLTMAFVAFLPLLVSLWLWYSRKEGTDATKRKGSVSSNRTEETCPSSETTLSGDDTATPTPSEKDTTTGQERKAPTCTEGELNETAPNPDELKAPPPTMPDLSPGGGKGGINLVQKAKAGPEIETATTEATTAVEFEAEAVGTEDPVNSATSIGTDAKEEQLPSSSEFQFVNYSEVTGTTSTKVVEEKILPRRDVSVDPKPATEVPCTISTVAASTPHKPRRPTFTSSGASNAAVSTEVHSTAADIQPIAGSPWTPDDYRRSVLAIASVVSSTGLDEERSLEIATESVIRRIEFSEKQRFKEEREARKQKLEEERREEDRKEAERRHKETMGAMRNEPSLEETLQEARKKCQNLAWSIFPLYHFHACIGITLAVMFVTQNFTTIRNMTLSGEGETRSTADFIFRVVIPEICGCAVDEASENEATQSIWKFFSYSSIAELMPSSVSPYWTLLSSTACCISRIILFILLFYMLQTGMRAAGSETLNQGLKGFIMVYLFVTSFMSALVRQSPDHESGLGLFFNVIWPVVMFNLVVMIALLIFMRQCKSRSDAAAQGMHESDEAFAKCYKQEVSDLNGFKWPAYISSSCFAYAVGFYWGARSW